MTASITLAKGSYSVTILITEVQDHYKKKLTIIPNHQTVQNQTSGPKEAKVVDLLILTHEFIIRGVITPTDSKKGSEVKSDLQAIIKGAGTSGGSCTLTYAGTSYNVYMEDQNIIESSKKIELPDDVETNYTNYQDAMIYEVTLTLVEGGKA